MKWFFRISQSGLTMYVSPDKIHWEKIRGNFSQWEIGKREFFLNVPNYLDIKDVVKALNIDNFCIYAEIIKTNNNFKVVRWIKVKSSRLYLPEIYISGKYGSFVEDYFGKVLNYFTKVMFYDSIATCYTGNYWNPYTLYVLGDISINEVSKYNLNYTC